VPTTVTSAAASAALIVSDLHYRYSPDARWAVDHVDFRLVPGEIVGLLGPNGAGKSTLLRLVSGLLQPDRGRIERPDAPAFALVGQENAFYLRLTCRENLAFFAAAARVPEAMRKDRVEACLRVTALTDHANRRAEQCSGGARRRLNLAIGLLSDPALLLLDEPTANVDPQARAFLLDTVRDLRARGKAIVYASHYMEEVEAICDRIAIIDNGKLILSGRLDEILGAERTLRVRVQTEAPPPSGWQSLGPGVWTRHLGPRESLSSALAVLETEGIALRNVQFGARDLEDVFLSLTHRSLRD
jgi:ABC-2 type transport system ATP-binding protein